MKQGIVAILGSDGGPKAAAAAAASIRRTLSADMSSKNWLHQNGMKKIVSSQELIKLPPSDSYAEDDKSPPLTDVWMSILCSRKSETGNSGLPPPYVHPLQKRSSGGLSEKSLEICTESLGSETGSACFSSEGGENREIGVLEEELKEVNQFEDSFCSDGRRYNESPPAQASPPPIRCISGEYGSRIHMYSRRENGKLVVEAVSVPPRDYFQAQRCDGRLVLRLVHAPAMNHEMSEEEDENEDDGVTDFQKVFNDIEETQEETDDEAAEEEFPLQRSPAAVKNLIPIGHRNLTAAVEDELTVPQSLPPLLRVPRLIPPTAASFNAYDYFWRNMAGAGGSKNKLQMKDRNSEVGVMKGCKDGRRSLLIWEPFHCIATT